MLEILGKCDVCGKETKSTFEHSFPEDIRNEENYCVCIPWESMKYCVDLSLDNAQRLLEDSMFLLDSKRLSSSRALAIFSIEESGRALLGCDFMARKKKITVEEYKSKFLDHKIKILKALGAIRETFSINFLEDDIGSSFAKKLINQRLGSFYVDYDGSFKSWHIPWSTDPVPLIKMYGPTLLDLKRAMTWRRLTAGFDRLVIKDLIGLAQKALVCGKQRFAWLMCLDDVENFFTESNSHDPL